MAQASVTNAGRKNALCSAVRWADNYSPPSLACITPSAIKRFGKEGLTLLKGLRMQQVRRFIL